MSSVVLIGRAQPIPERVAALHLGDMCALPCWIGITPGKTTLAEAERLIAKVYNGGQPLNFSMGKSLSIKTQSEISFSVTVYHDPTTENDEIIDEIALYGDAIEALPIGDAINALGLPEYIFIQPEGGCSLLSKSWGQFGFNCEQYRELVHIGEATTEIFLYPVDTVPVDYHVQWRGFGVHYQKTVYP